jgi:hypothetical protein
MVGQLEGERKTGLLLKGFVHSVMWMIRPC